MGVVEEYLPAIAMLGLQAIYAIVTLISRAALLEGMSPRVFIVYRQAFATLSIAPVAYFSRSKSMKLSLDFKSFYLIFLAALAGTTINLNFFYEGLFLASSSLATAMENLIPAMTFLIAGMVGMESVKMKNLRSMAKIGGTVVCMGGAMFMAFLRGPKLLNATQGFGVKSAIFDVESGSHEAWLLGSLSLLGSCVCWSIWLILQVPAMESYPDKLSLSAWTCFFSLIQSVGFTLWVEGANVETWKIHSNTELVCYLFSGIFGSGVAYYLQAWGISKRGPVFSAVFIPFCTIITTVLAAIFLHEEIYSGSLLGGVVVIIGLYVFLWGKANEGVKEEDKERSRIEKQEGCESNSVDKNSYKIDMEEPLLKGCTDHIDN
ncbi:WAT1-related protein At4g30420-like [Cucurbita moschata]|uniref:WAT1-related protein n=1 Tax=Cucurbita moschata TaxID=3662 RepID=A0A6J1FCX0_CUCMO|nr:WAT1-related protein At4g30420-like [Cucurbita moschata]